MQVTQTRWHRTKFKGACMEAWQVHRKSLHQHAHTAHRKCHTRKAESHLQPCSTVPVLLLCRHRKKLKLLAKKAILC